MSAMRWTSRRKVWIGSVTMLALAAAALVSTAFLAGWFAPGSPSPRTEEPSSPASRPAISAGDVSPAPSASTARVGYRVNDRAPDFALESLAGEIVSLSQFDGQMVILDFWASWCVPCRTSMPRLHALWQEFRDQGVVFVGVNLDRSEIYARTYLERNGFSDITALWGSLDASSAVAQKFGISGIPHTFLIDRHGIIRFANHPALLTKELIETHL